MVRQFTGVAGLAVMLLAGCYERGAVANPDFAIPKVELSEQPSRDGSMGMGGGMRYLTEGQTPQGAGAAAKGSEVEQTPDTPQGKPAPKEDAEKKQPPAAKPTEPTRRTADAKAKTETSTPKPDGK